MWLTEDDANIDPEGGGLIVYDLVAPSAWSLRILNTEQTQMTYCWLFAKNSILTCSNLVVVELAAAALPAP